MPSRAQRQRSVLLHVFGAVAEAWGSVLSQILRRSGWGVRVGSEWHGSLVQGGPFTMTAEDPEPWRLRVVDQSDPDSPSPSHCARPQTHHSTVLRFALLKMRGWNGRSLRPPVGLHFQREVEIIHILFGSPRNPQHVKYWENGGYLVGAQ